MVPVVWRGPGAVQIALGGPGRVLDDLTEEEVSLLLGTVEPGPDDLDRRGVAAERWESLAAWRRDAAPREPGALPDLLALDSRPLTAAVSRRAEHARRGRLGGASAVRVLTDYWVTDPLRVRPLLAGDHPHLPITIDDLGITVGPLVVPGVTACTRCLDLWRTDADRAWPVAATQLRISREPAVSPLLREVAASLALLSLQPGAPGWRVELDHVGEVRVEPHPLCGCIRPPSADGPSPS